MLQHATFYEPCCLHTTLVYVEWQGCAVLAGIGFAEGPLVYQGGQNKTTLCLLPVELVLVLVDLTLLEVWSDFGAYDAISRHSDWYRGVRIEGLRCWCSWCRVFWTVGECSVMCKLYICNYIHGNNNNCLIYLENILGYLLKVFNLKYILWAVNNLIHIVYRLFVSHFTNHIYSKC